MCYVGRSMDKRVLYLGDTSLATAAAYLAAVMTYHGIAFDYVDSDTPCDDALLDQDYAVIIISDYASKQFSAAQQSALIERVRQKGIGLWMIGGWETHVGLGGDYHESALAEILPVHLQNTDDRINSYAPCMITLESEHAIVDGLPFKLQAPAINGYNQFTAKSDAQTLLSVKRYAVVLDSDFTFSEVSIDPLLVIAEEGHGRVANYAGDVAPHWAGGFVDWGDERHALQAAGAGDVEIGNWYIQFFGNIIKWLAREL